MRAGRQLVAVAVGLAALLLAGRLAAAAWADHAWYAALGGTALWQAKVVNTVLLHGTATLLGSAFVFANLWAVRHSVAKLVLPRRMGNLEFGEEVPGTYLLGAIGVLSLAVGALLAFAHDDWTTLARARYLRPFDEIDPYFGKDLSFYVGWLPLERSWFLWAQLTLVAVTVLVVVLYALTPSLRWERGSLRVTPHVRRHFSVLGALLLLLLAWSCRLDLYLPMVDGGAVAGLYGWVDHQVARPATTVLSVLTIAAAVLVLWSGFTGQIRMAFGVVTSVLVLALALQEIVPAVAPRLGAGPPRAERDRPYLVTRALYVRRAFDVEAVAVGAPAEPPPALAALVSAVPVWDAGAVVATLTRGTRRGELLGDVGWSAAGAQIEAVALLHEAIDDSLSRWSVASAAVTRADANGPVSRGLPVQLRAVAPPLVHPGARGYRVVADTVGHVAAPLVTGRLARLAHAWSVQNLQLLLGDLPAVRPRLVRHRDVRERVRRLAPDFVQGRTVWPVMAGDSLYWMLPLYAAARTYPLSLHLAGGDDWTYFQHAATAVVHARTGRVVFVPEARLDPVAASWVDRFPELYVSWAELPAELERRRPPPLDAAHARIAALVRVGPGSRPWPERLHVAPTGADSLFGGDVPVLVGAGDAPLRWTAPVLDDDDRIVGIATATGGETARTGYLPLDGPGPRWTTVRERLRRPPAAAPPLAADETVAAGAVRTLVSAEGLVHVQPFFGTRLQQPPNLRHVAVLLADSLELAPTFAAAIVAPIAPPDTTLADGDGLRRRAAALYERAREALRDGDWPAFGAAWDSLGRTLRVRP